MKVKKEELLSVLSILKPGLGLDSSVAEQFSCFTFIGSHVTTYNGWVSISCEFPTDFTCSVHGLTFYKLLQDIEEDELNISMDKEEGCLKVVSSSVEAELRVLGAITEEAEAVPSFDDETWCDVPDDFTEAISLSCFSVSRDMTQGVLTSLSIKDNLVQSTDNFRISLYKMDSKFNLPDELLLPYTSVVLLSNFNVNRYLLSEDKSWIYFLVVDNETSIEAVFSSRLTKNSNYPYCESVFESIEGIEVSIDVKRISQKVSFLSSFSNSPVLDKTMKLTIDENVLVGAEVFDSSKGKVSKEFVSLSNNVDKDNRNLEIFVNPVYFLQVLEVLERVSDNIDMIVSEDYTKAWFIAGKLNHLMALPVSNFNY